MVHAEHCEEGSYAVDLLLALDIDILAEDSVETGVYVEDTLENDDDVPVADEVGLQQKPNVPDLGHLEEGVGLHPQNIQCLLPLPL